MIGQKERACPCANTDKPKENTDSFLPSEYTIDCDCLQYAGVLYYAVDDRGRKFQASTVLRLSDSQLRELIHWLHYHLKGSNPPPALYHLEMLLQSLEYLRGGRHYLYNSVWRRTHENLYPRDPRSGSALHCRDVPPRQALRGGRDERYPHYLHIPQERL